MSKVSIKQVVEVYTKFYDNWCVIDKSSHDACLLKMGFLVRKTAEQNPNDAGIINAAYKEFLKNLPTY